YNPASFAISQNYWGAVSFEKPFSSFKNQTHSMISVALPTKDYGVFAITLNNFWSESPAFTSTGGPDIIGLANDKPELFSPTHIQLKGSYANMLSENMAFGISLSLLNTSYSNVQVGQEQGSGEAFTVLVDAGFLMNNLFVNSTYTKPTKLKNNFIQGEENLGFSVGFALLNFGPKIFFIDKEQEDYPPSLILLGFSYWALSTDFISTKIAFDLENRIYDSGGFDYIHIGSDLRFYKLFSIRAGYVFDNVNSELSYFTVGGGLITKYGSFNVARYKKYITPTWSFDIRINFGY
ncbi:MAG: hypothetical protein ABFS12_15900, partial [Bacteroidota bacterium]